MQKWFACPCYDYEAKTKLKFNLNTCSWRLAVNLCIFCIHLRRHFEQLALFNLPKQEVIEQVDNIADSVATSDATDQGEIMPSDQAANFDDNENIEDGDEEEIEIQSQAHSQQVIDR